MEKKKEKRKGKENGKKMEENIRKERDNKGR